MAKWIIELPVADEDAHIFDDLVNSVELAFRYAADFKPQPDATVNDWLNGLLAGLAEVSNVTICPEEYNEPLETRRQAALRLASLLILFSLATYYSMQKAKLEELQQSVSASSSTMDNESITSPTDI